MKNHLIGIPSPRDIDDFTNSINKLPTDKFWAKYYNEKDAYQIIRDFFLASPEYDYLCICPDDLIVTPRDYEILTKDIEEFDFPVLAGICNMTYDSKEYLTASVLDPHRRFTHEELFSGEPIKQVEFDGFAFSFIRRDVAEEIEFKGESRFDYQFALECNNLKIPMHVDVRANMTHLANRIGTHENMQLGKKEPLIRFQQYFSLE
jgi:hypothetical protein